MARKLKTKTVMSVGAMLAKIREGKTVLEFQDGQVIYSQGDVADSVYYIPAGWVKRTAVCRRGREAVLGIFGPGECFGERSLTDGEPLRSASAISVGHSALVRVAKESMTQFLRGDSEFASAFLSQMVQRAGQEEDDLVDRLFNSTEKRLARVLLRLAKVEGQSDSARVASTGTVVPPGISQETLAQMIGASRSRVSSFLNKFRRLGLIEYNGRLRVHRPLLSEFLGD